MQRPNLLIATDLLPKSERALQRGSALACSLDADVSLLHVVAADQPLEEGVKQRTEHALKRMRELVRPLPWPVRSAAHTLVRVGTPPWRTIVETITTLRADLTVLGAHEMRGKADRLATALGTTLAARVLAARVSPTLIVREPVAHPYRRVLLALDMSSNADSAIRAVESLVLTPEADASVLHAFDTPYFGAVEHLDRGKGMSARYRSLWQSQATVSVRALLRRASSNFTRYGIQIEDEPPARAILSAVNHQEPDLLVMGTSGRGPWRRAFIGSVANEVLNRAWCDVLIVPQGSFQQKPHAMRGFTHRPVPQVHPYRHRWH
jgi:nucleotide-binding universal stress UspA family protein